MYHYTYLITNIQEEKHYIGSRSTHNIDNDLGMKYFSSSTDKKFIQDQKQNPQKYQYQILEHFESRNAAIESEMLLHRYFDVAKSQRFYNKAIQKSSGFDTTGSKNTAHQRFAKSDKTVYHFIHPTFGKRDATRLDMMNEFDLDSTELGRLVSGIKKKPYRGWWIDGRELLPHANKTGPKNKEIHQFYNPTVGVVIDTIVGLSERYHLQPTYISELVAGNRKTTQGGWTIRNRSEGQ